MHQSLVHLLGFAVVADRSRELRAAVVRDAFAVMPLQWLLWQEGFGLGDTFLNFPLESGSRNPLPLSEYTDYDLARLRPGDLLLQATRFPLHDTVAQHRKRVPRGYTNLETLLEKFWGQFFSFLDRGTAQLTPDVRRSLLPGCEAYANIEFQLNGGSDVRFVDDGAGSRGAPPLPGSLAFFLRTDQVFPGGPGLCAAFAMDAEATAAWTWLLCNKMRDLTQRRGFYICALESPPERRSQGWYGDIAGEWKAQLVLEHPFVDETG